MERQATDRKQDGLSVIVVSDYAAGDEKAWGDLRRALRAWADQEGMPADEFILVESLRFKGLIPSDVLEMVPDMRVLYIDAESSYELKNLAVEAATGDWVVIVDADCVPRRSWLRALRADLAEYPDIAAVSARTLYPGRSRMERVLGLLGRSYLDPGRRGPTRFISGNAACFRREVYRRHPLPVGCGAFASRIQSEAFLRDGATFLFNPELVVVHDFEGWPMERDIRCNHGYSTVITRLRDCFRCFRQYNVKVCELPLALILNVVTHVLEIPGMLAAYRGQAIERTAFR